MIKYLVEEIITTKESIKKLASNERDNEEYKRLKEEIAYLRDDLNNITKLNTLKVSKDFNLNKIGPNLSNQNVLKQQMQVNSFLVFLQQNILETQSKVDMLENQNLLLVNK